MYIKKNPAFLIEYFRNALEKLDPENKEKVISIFNEVPEEYYNYPAASGSHHNALQAKENGLLYHVSEGLMALNQFIRARTDIINKYSTMKNYEGTVALVKDKSGEKYVGMPEIDLICAYLLHDIVKYKMNPTGTNYTHDEDAYEFAKSKGFNKVICNIIRFTHGQWSTAYTRKKIDFTKNRYIDLIWLSHYSDMVASSQENLVFLIENDDLKLMDPYNQLKDFDKSIFDKRKKMTKEEKESNQIDKIWWK